MSGTNSTSVTAGSPQEAFQQLDSFIRKCCGKGCPSDCPNLCGALNRKDGGGFFLNRIVCVGREFSITTLDAFSANFARPPLATDDFTGTDVDVPFAFSDYTPGGPVVPYTGEFGVNPVLGNQTVDGFYDYNQGINYLYYPIGSYSTSSFDLILNVAPFECLPAARFRSGEYGPYFGALPDTTNCLAIFVPSAPYTAPDGPSPIEGSVGLMNLYRRKYVAAADGSAGDDYVKYLCLTRTLIGRVACGGSDPGSEFTVTFEAPGFLLVWHMRIINAF